MNSLCSMNISAFFGLIARMKKYTKAGGLMLASVLALLISFPSHAIDLVAFTGLGGPLVPALTSLAELTPSVKAIVAVVGFIVAFISLTALRNFGPVLSYIGMAVFGAVGLVVAGAIMGADVSMLQT